jgi:beta-barrel assembly-enhancing protease
MAFERRRGNGGRLVIALVIAGVSVAGYLSRRSTNEITGETQYVKLTEAQEVSLGLASAPQMAREYGGATGDRELARYVGAVGARVASRSAANKTRYPFTFVVLADKTTVNAFALPGGPVFITEALLSRLHNEAQLAGVLGHEIGHVIARHGAEHLAKADLTSGLVGATVVAASDPDRPGASRAKAAVAMAAAQLISMKFGRDDELEADRLGTRFMQEAGYEPKQMAEVMKVLKAAGGGRTPEFFSTHPDPENRLEKIAEVVATLPSGGEVSAEAFDSQVLNKAPNGAPAPAEQPARVEARLPVRPRSAAMPTIKVAQLSAEAREALKQLTSNSRAGDEYSNRDGALPYRPGGYYRQHGDPNGLVIVSGANGERYLREGPERSFSLVVP